MQRSFARSYLNKYGKAAQNIIEKQPYAKPCAVCFVTKMFINTKALFYKAPYMKGNKMKKILSVITCIAAVLSLAACRSGENEPADNSSNAAQSSAAQNSTQSTAQSTVVSVSTTGSSAGVSEPTSSVPQSQPESSADTESQPEETSKPKASYSFQREDGGVEILGGKDEGTEVVVPSKVNDMDVVGISGNPNKTMFPNAQKITLPDTLREIDDYAFAGCAALKSINIPANVTDIDDFAFSECSALTTVNIPASVEDIGEFAFKNCTSLSTVTFSEGLKDIGTGAFAGCTSLTLINLPNSVQELETNAFDINVAFTVTYKGNSYTPSNISELYSLLADY